MVFSPDGNRYAYCGQSGSQYVVMVDSKHLFWARTDPSGRFRLYMDGKPVLDAAVGGTNVFTDRTWQMGADGTLAILVQDDTSFKRVSITPSPDTSLDTVLAGGR